jgi:4-amino-4-deoxy-L-arabinose transferase-like glycosyltransferase
MQLPPTYPPKHISRVLRFFCLFAIVLTMVQHMVTLRMPFTYEAATISADVSTMARSFAQHGIFRLGGVPINNNDPLGISRAAYTHWPPLLPMLLSLLFRLFGESEAAGHGLMAIILLLTASLLYLIARQCLPAKGAYLAVLFYLTLPVIVRFSILISQQSLAMLFMLLALLSFLMATKEPAPNRLWSGVACVAMCLAVWSSWEPFWLPFSLLAVAAWKRSKAELRLAKLLCIVSVGAVAMTIFVYLLGAPEALADTLQTIKYRIGIAKTYSYLPLHRHTPDDPIGIGRIVRNLGRFYPELLGAAGVLAVVWLLLTAIDRFSPHPSGPLRAPTVFAGLFGPWFIWYGTMLNHVAKHSFEMLVAAPAAAMAMAYCANGILDALDRRIEERRLARMAAILVIVPVLSLAPLVSAIRGHLLLGRRGALPAVRLNPNLYEPDADMRLAAVVRSQTPANAIVITSLTAGVPIYYSKRHIIRLIMDDADLMRILPMAQRSFPGDPLFLALPPDSISRFPESIGQSSRIAQTPDVLVCRLNAIGN